MRLPSHGPRALPAPLLMSAARSWLTTHADKQDQLTRTREVLVTRARDVGLSDAEISALLRESPSNAPSRPANAGEEA